MNMTRNAPSRRPALTALLAGTLSFLAAMLVTAASPPSLEDRDLEVLSALINHGLESGTPMVIIAERTTGDPVAIAADDDTLNAIIAGLEIPRDAYDHWTVRNRASHVIDRPLDLSVSYQMLNDKTLSELFKDVTPADGWTTFFTRYAGAPGILRVSRPGFDDTFTHALVYVEHACGAECGAGRLVHLVRGSGDGQGNGQRWQVQDGAMVWMTK